MESHTLTIATELPIARVNICSISVRPIILDGQKVHCLPLSRRYERGVMTKPNHEFPRYIMAAHKETSRGKL